MKFETIDPDAIESLREQAEFIPVAKYGRIEPMQGEIGAVRDTRYTTGDPVIRKRRNEILASHRGFIAAEPALRAECAVMGHVRVADTASCIYCGAKP